MALARPLGAGGVKRKACLLVARRLERDVVRQRLRGRRRRQRQMPLALDAGGVLPSLRLAWGGGRGAAEGAETEEGTLDGSQRHGKFLGCGRLRPPQNDSGDSSLGEGG